MRLFDGTPVRPVALVLARGLDLAAAAFDFVACGLCAYAAWRLWGEAVSCYEAAGGTAFLTYLRQAVPAAPAEALRQALPGLHARALWYGLAWGAAVFACGFGCLALAGGRSLHARVQVLLRSV